MCQFEITRSVFQSIACITIPAVNFHRLSWNNTYQRINSVHFHSFFRTSHLQYRIQSRV